MAELEEIYSIKEICYKDESGVYLSGEMVALDNSFNNGYIRWDGAREIEKIGIQTYLVKKPLVFVGAVPYGDPSSMIRATVSALTSGAVEVLEVLVDKPEIASLEGMELEDLTRFSGVGMIWVKYDLVQTETFCAQKEPVAITPAVGVFDLTFDISFN